MPQMSQEVSRTKELVSSLRPKDIIINGVRKDDVGPDAFNVILSSDIAIEPYKENTRNTLNDKYLQVITVHLGEPPDEWSGLDGMVCVVTPDDAGFQVFKALSQDEREVLSAAIDCALMRAGIIGVGSVDFALLRKIRPMETLSDLFRD